MIALDTNVLVRVLVDDEPAQARKARAILDRCLADDEACFVSDVVLAETVWVLEGPYRFSRKEIAATLHRLIVARPLVFESRERLLGALDGFDAGRGDFSDYVVLRRAIDAGASALYSFDRKLLRETGVRQP